jgi:hypothetical protein
MQRGDGTHGCSTRHERADFGCWRSAWTAVHADSLYVTEMSCSPCHAGQARLVMRQRGNLRLLLNANLWDDMAVSVMDGGVGVTFAVQNAVAVPAAGGKDGGAKDSATAGLWAVSQRHSKP